MQPHIRTYRTFFSIADDEFWPCEICGARCVDIHHIVRRGEGGGDDINNLIGLCRRCHQDAHSKYTKEHLREAHKQFVKHVNHTWIH